jgi:serine/threonine protein kinase
VLYELTCGKFAFQGANMRALISNIVRGVYAPPPPQYTAALRELISQMLQTNPRNRLSIHQILKKPIMRDRIQNFLSRTGLQQEFSHTVIHGRPSQGALIVQAPMAPTAQAPQPALISPSAAVPALGNPGQRLPGKGRYGAALLRPDNSGVALIAQQKRLDELRMQLNRARERAAVDKKAEALRMEQRREAQELAHQHEQQARPLLTTQ